MCVQLGAYGSGAQIGRFHEIDDVHLWSSQCRWGGFGLNSRSIVMLIPCVKRRQWWQCSVQIEIGWWSGNFEVRTLDTWSSRPLGTGKSDTCLAAIIMQGKCHLPMTCRRSSGYVGIQSLRRSRTSHWMCFNRRVGTDGTSGTWSKVPIMKSTPALWSLALIVARRPFVLM